MDASDFIELLGSFVSGRSTVSQFRKSVDEAVFELRSDPSRASEQRSLLSTIQLYLHEIEDGLRDKHEVYMVTRTILDQYLSALRRSEVEYYSDVPSPPVTSTTSAPPPSYEEVAGRA